MELKHMRYFLMAADMGSLTKAAESLGIAQPALSQVITRMETELGVKLLTRSRRGATLTTAGRAILDDVREIIGRTEVATTTARAIGAGRSGRISIGFATSAVGDVLPHALRKFRAAMPDVQISLHEMNTMEQTIALDRRVIDIGILHTPAPLPARVREKVVAREHTIAAVPLDFPLDKDGKVHFGDIAAAGLITLSERNLPFLRSPMLSAIAQKSGEIRIVQEVNRTLTALACVSAGMGVALLPSSATAVHPDGVRFCEIHDAHMLPTFELTAVWMAGSRESLADRFADVMPSA